MNNASPFRTAYHRHSERKGEDFFMDRVSLVLVIIGAINWGLIGFFNFNLVSFLFGSMTWLSRIIYAIVGICGIYLLSFYTRTGKES